MSAAPIKTVSAKMILQLSADSRDTLRSCDVWRVMEQAQRLNVAEQFRIWLLKEKNLGYGVREEVTAWK